MQDYTERIDKLLEEFKAGKFIYREDYLGQVGDAARGFGNSALLVRNHFPGMEPFAESIHRSVESSGVVPAEEVVNMIRPNAPVEDMLKLKNVQIAV